MHSAKDHTYTSVTLLSALLDDVEVEVSHANVGLVALPIAGQRQIGENKVDGLEAAVKVMVDVREALVESGAHFLSLQGSGSGADGNLGRAGESIVGLRVGDGSSFVSDVGLSKELVVDIVEGLFDDNRHVFLEGLGRKAELGGKVRSATASAMRVAIANATHLHELLLLHEEGVVAVIDDLGAKDTVDIEKVRWASCTSMNMGAMTDGVVRFV